MSEEKKPTPITMKEVQAKAEEKKCPLQQTLVFIEEFLAEPMCGRCFPCSFGSYEARIRIKKIADGTATDEDIARLKRISSNMLEASMCKKGKDTAKFIAEKIESGEYIGHIGKECSSKECITFFEYIIIPDKCTSCGICRDVCKDNAITGEKRKPYLSGYLPFEIAQKRCTKCGECIKVCPEGAIEFISISAEKEPAGV
jgi:NAD-dependent dihydropyrimidine dehydrogenase PreA subunit